MSEDPKSKDQIFYLPLSERAPTPAFRDLLENYSKIPKDEISKHLEEVRDDAWNHYPHPSIGLFIFLDLGLCGDDLPKEDPTNPGAIQAIASAYSAILQKLKNGSKFLDVGCMFAQDLRKLVHDGAPPDSVYGTDLRGEYFEFGYKLFRDERVVPRDHFIAADILDPEAPDLKQLDGKLDVINATHLIHVFNLEDQRTLIKRFMGLLREGNGVMVTGRMTGHLEAGYIGGANVKSTTKSGGEIWEHNCETFEKLWKEVSEERCEKWEVKSWFWRFGIHCGLTAGRESWFREEGHGIVTFVATRL
ncbi:hypothetical protein N431DRAFT_342609 [Stipitochalara longipes BDJ]|nr:hypothetical protein N431DRAFT_342609 [Stipitochalara longipes BDJ]